MYLITGTLLYSCPIRNTILGKYSGIARVYRKRHILLRAIIKRHSLCDIELIIHNKYYDLTETSRFDDDRYEYFIMTQRIPMYNVGITYNNRLATHVYCIIHHVYVVCSDTIAVYNKQQLTQVAYKIDF